MHAMTPSAIQASPASAAGASSATTSAGPSATQPAGPSAGPIPSIAAPQGPLADWRGQALVVFRYEDADLPRELTSLLEELSPGLTSCTAFEDARGTSGKVSPCYLDAPAGQTPPFARILVAGLGKREAATADTLRGAAAAVARTARALRLSSLAVPAEALAELPLEPAAAAEEILLACAVGAYRYRAAVNEPPEDAGYPASVGLLVRDPDSESALALAKATRRAAAQAAGIALTRDLVNAPANLATPSFMAETAEDLAQDYGFSVEVLDPEACRSLGMGAFLAVAQGSSQPAHFVVLLHQPPAATAPSGEAAKPLVLIGKGITFDTGGISLKPSASMEKMKSDMAGAAAVLGAFKALGMLGADAPQDTPVVGILPLTENMPDAAAIKPGDVVRAMTGTTIEIINTDAEGRLVLCDALGYAERFDPDLVVDIATLTGACVVALGSDTAAVYSPEAPAAEYIRDTGWRLGERFWPMPLWDSFAEALKSEVADLRNVGPREGGSIHAAMFLKRFVPKDARWLHLDIAGPGFTDADKGPWTKGGTGFGVRTLLALMENPDIPSGSSNA